MAIQLADLTKNARLDAIETEIGASPILAIRSGAPPATCATADSGTLIATMTLPTSGGGDWMAAASGGTKAKSGTWSVAASAGGTAGHFRIYVGPGGTVCKMQGTCGLASGDLQLDNNVITASQVVTITGFTLTDGN